ncbi:hypothetical protein HG434_000260 [Candidatus Saccharibacteria bacterium]|nr:hypothetical protein [Candidatus Saccharibacteria bacterium]
MSEAISGDGFILTPGPEADELCKAHGITDPKRQRVALEGVAAAISNYLSDPGIAKCRSSQPSSEEIENFIASGEQREMLRSQCQRPLGEIALRDETINRTRARGQRKLLPGLRPSKLVNKAAHARPGSGRRDGIVKSEYVPVDLTALEYLEKEFITKRLPDQLRILLTDPREFLNRD